jgi:hypothetical protein
MSDSRPTSPRRAPDSVCNCTCFNLRKATRAVTQFYDDALRPAGADSPLSARVVVAERRAV